MQINELLDCIKAILTKKFLPDELLIIDESHFHAGHSGHGGAKHIFVKIRAVSFNHCSRVEAHRAIYQALASLMPQEIHALRIEIS